MDFSANVTERMCTEFQVAMANMIDSGLLGFRTGLDDMKIGDRVEKFILAFREP
jgi:hypothetical protein